MFLLSYARFVHILYMEDSNHLFIKCEIAVGTWNVIFRWIDVSFLGMDGFEELVA